MAKDEILHLRIAGEQKKKIKLEAKRRGVTVPGYVIEALSFFGCFDFEFLRHHADTAKGLHLPFGVFIQQLLTTYMAEDCARLAVNGEGTVETYGRAFVFDGGGLVTGRRHFDMVFEEAKKEAEGLRGKPEKAAVRARTTKGKETTLRAAV